MSSVTTSTQECTGGPSQRSKAKEINKMCKDWQEKNKTHSQMIHWWIEKMKVSTEKVLEIKTEQDYGIQNQLCFYVNSNHGYKIKLKKKTKISFKNCLKKTTYLAIDPKRGVQIPSRKNHKTSLTGRKGLNKSKYMEWSWFESLTIAETSILPKLIDSQSHLSENHNGIIVNTLISLSV